MFCTNHISGETILDNLIALIRSSTLLNIVTGYIGESAVVRLLPEFNNFVNRGETARIFIGRALQEGLYQETLDACMNLHSILNQTGGGVFAMRNPFHSKVYAGQIDGEETAWIGSSNLSVNGLIDWREANVRITDDHPSMRSVLNEINQIRSQTLDLSHIRIVQRTVRRPRVGVIRQIDEYPSGPNGSEVQVLELPLYSRQTGQVQNRSGLNWWNAGGRQRSPNEACIGLSVIDIRRNINFFPNRANEGTTFTAYIEDGSSIEMMIEGGGPFDNHTGQWFGKQIASRHDKSVFGEWILRNRLGLSNWTLVTRQILSNYGRETIEFVKISDTDYIMRF